MTALYRVEKDPLHGGHYIIVVVATGKQAFNTVSYPNKGQATKACNAKNNKRS